MPRTVLVFSGGQPLTISQVERLKNVSGVSAVVAADAGADRALAAGFEVDVLVGDLDSISADGLRRVEADGVRVDRHPVAKNETDLELAMLEALGFEPARIVVTAIDGGRPDHYLANVSLLADPRFRGYMVSAQAGEATVHVVWDHIDLEGDVGEIISVLPVNGPADGITTTGLRYPLASETLEASSPRGMSNVMVARSATVTVEHGTLLVVRSGEREVDAEPDEASGAT